MDSSSFYLTFDGDGAENAPLQVTGLAVGIVTGCVFGPFTPLPATDRSSRTAVGGR
jgi:hypothetical protein